MKTQPLPETLHNYGPSPTTSSNVAGVKDMEMSLLERHTLSLKHQQEQLLQLHPQLQQSCFSDLSLLPFLSPQLHDFWGLNMGLGPDPSLTRPIKPDPGSENSWADFEMAKSGIDSVGQVDSCSSYGVVKCQPLMVARVESETKERGSLVTDKKLGLKKRKPEMSQALEGNAEENSMSKKSKDCVEEEESKITEQNSDRKVNNANKNDRTKSKKDSKPDYIHVRARRGQATDSHSLAERVRREKISERMKYLQDLVPGCNKITGKAGMLDEIINYVQSLQRQVEFLSMKLAAVNPSLDFNIDDLIAREVFTDCSTSMPTMGVCQEMTDPNYLQYNPIQQMDQVCGSEPSINPIDMGLRRTIDAHVSVSVPETFIDQSYLNQISSSLPWHADLQNIYNMEFQQERSTLFPLLPFAGTIETSNLKMEM